MVHVKCSRMAGMYSKKSCGSLVILGSQNHSLACVGKRVWSLEPCSLDKSRESCMDICKVGTVIPSYRSQITVSDSQLMVKPKAVGERAERAPRSGSHYFYC